MPCIPLSPASKRHAWISRHLLHSTRDFPPRLSDERASRRALVPPGVGQGSDRLVVTRQAVDARLDENEAELAVLVLAVALEMLADGDGLDVTVSNV